jgi:hypothetical protein
METGIQRCSRVIAALEDLAEQESAALVHRDFSAVLALQDRAGTLISFLASAREKDRAQANDRLKALHARRERTHQALAAELEGARRALQETSVAQNRGAQVAPAYGRPSVARPQLFAVG